MERTHGRSKELLNLEYLSDHEMIKLYGEPTQGFKTFQKKDKMKKSVKNTNKMPSLVSCAQTREHLQENFSLQAGS